MTTRQNGWVRIVEVGASDDPRLDDFRGLTDADVRPDRRGIVIAEGVNVVQRLITSPYRVRAVFGVPDRIDALRADLDALDIDVFIWTLSRPRGSSTSESGK